MKLIILVALACCAQFALSEGQVKPQARAYMSFLYKAGSVAAYPPGTTIIYKPGTVVDYIAGSTAIYVYTTTITFEEETTIYGQNGPETFAAGQSVTFPAGTQVVYAPGASVLYGSVGETRYGEFNGNTHTLAAYPSDTSVQYYYGPRGSNLILFQPGSNPLTFYNPGGSTQFGPSALPVEKDPEVSATPTTRTYGYRGGGYSYCSGYSYQGYPQTTYYNSNTGYRSSCSQYGRNGYNYGGGWGGGGGGGGSYGGSYGK